MKVTEKSYSVDLGNNLTAYVKIERAGQELPSIGNDVVVRAHLGLPMTKESGFTSLDDEIRYGHKCEILNERLVSGWGRISEDPALGTDFPEGFRVNSGKFYGKTWKEAFNAAENNINNQLNQLITLISERNRALEDAEE